jgi:hypothetical protein|tara:strand:+ start:98 stop:1240 length:1143 start_codon:yes stop_codon:yes gene_type:complete
MSLILDGTNGITNLTSINSGQLGGRRNLVMNGEMKVAQRTTSSAGLGADAMTRVLDRWGLVTNTGDSATAGRVTMAQVADGPSGFANCLKLTTTTADTSIAAGEVMLIQHAFEGQDLQGIYKGVSGAKQVTVSFYVKGNANATYTCELFDRDNLRTIGQAFAVTTDWNRIELTFAADEDDGSSPFDDDNNVSLHIQIFLHGGSTFSGGTFVNNTWANQTNNTRMAESHTSILDATSRTFFITGVQMEIGATATDFEHRSYGEELLLCQRYFQQWGGDLAYGYFGGVASITTTSNAFMPLLCTVEMRANPTFAFVGAASVYDLRNNGNASHPLTGLAGDQLTKTVAGITLTRSNGDLTADVPGQLIGNNSTVGRLQLSADI